MDTYKIGIDLGGTKTEAILLDHQDQELYRRRQPTPEGNDYSTILAVIQDAAMDAISKIPGNGPYTIGIGIPGAINPDTDLVQNANTTCLIGKPVQKDLEERFDHPIRIENDANCFTLVESLWGAGKGYGLVFGIIMGTGCGGGICIDGQIRQGSHNIAGEWGHISVDPNGAECYCGKRGCIETKISGGGVEATYATTYGNRLTFRDIVKGYRNNDESCTEIFLQFIDDFGRCLGGLISILDPDVIVLGGGLSNIDELYTLGVESIQHYAFHENIKTPILRNQIGDSAGVIGAAWIGSTPMLHK